MNKKLIGFFICFLLLIAVVCGLNYRVQDDKKSASKLPLLETSELTLAKQNDPSNGSERKISMRSRQEAYTTSIKEIYVTIENNTLVDYNTDLGYTVEYFNGSSWDKVPLSFPINLPLVFLRPGESEEFNVYLYPEQYNYKPGRYRIFKTVESSSKDIQELTCEFNIE